MVNRICICLLISLFLMNCKSRKKVIDPVNVSQQKIDEIWNSNVDFDFLSIRSKANIESPTINIGFTLNVKMKKDSILWLSAGIMGFEGYRMLITTDSVKMLDKQNKKYYEYSILELEKLVGVNLSLTELQNLVVGNPMHEKEHYKLQGDSTGFLLVAENVNPISILSLNELGRIGTSKTIADSSRQELTIDYNDFEKYAIGKLPTLLNTTLSNKGVLSKMSLNYISIKDNPIGNFPLKVPSGFTKG